MKLRNRTLFVYNGEMDDNIDYQLSSTGRDAAVVSCQLPSSSSTPSTSHNRDKETTTKMKTTSIDKVSRKRKMRRVRRKPTTAKRTNVVDHSSSIQYGINDLPDHLLVDVFAQLLIVDRIRLERVSRRWRRLALHHSWSQSSVFSYASLLHTTTWRCIDDRPRVGNEQIRGILRRSGRHLVRIELGAFRDALNYSVCTSITQFCVRLQHLSLVGIQLTNSSLNLLGRHCGAQLRAINLQRCFQDSVVERGLSGFLSKCQRLQQLDVSENERLIGVPSLAYLPADLHTLVISGCFRLSGASIDHIRKQCTQLNVLAMDGVDMVTVDELNALFEPMAEIRTLKFGECFMTNTPGGSELTNLGRLTNIRELLLNDNLLITNAVCEMTFIYRMVQ